MNYLVLCCNYQCLKNEMNTFFHIHRNIIKNVNRTDTQITTTNDTFLFRTLEKEKLLAIEIAGYHLCPHLDLSEEMKQFLKSKIR